MTTQTKECLTAIGIARIIERGIKSNYAPEYQDEKLQELSELFIDMAMSRGQDADLTDDEAESAQALIDADWLDGIGTELDR